MLSIVLDLTHGGKEQQGHSSGLEKGPGTGDRQEIYSIVEHSCSMTPYQTRAKIPCTLQRAGNPFTGGETESGREEGSIFQRSLSSLGDYISS